MEEELQLKKRFSELYERSESRGCYVFTDFLNLAEQDILIRSVPKYSFAFFGGYENAERKLAVFGNEEKCGYTEEPPVVCVEISPLQQKFADELTHRDFLGALMSLGIKRETLGDIIVYNNRGYLFCLSSVSRYIVENCVSIKHTTVNCKEVDSPPVESIALPDESEIVVPALRCDAVLAAVYNLSRSESKKFFLQKLVFINSACCEDPSRVLKENDIVSLRGKGRFIYCGEKLVTKKNRLRVTVRVF
jgi:RNA-binding protein YlmH